MNRINLMGCPVDCLDTQQTIQKIEEYIAKKKMCQHVVVNAAKFVEMNYDKHLRDIIASCDIINADGLPVVWASRIIGTPLPCRVAGVDLFQDLIEVCAEKGYRPFFFGAREEVVTNVVAKFENMYPKLNVAGYRKGIIQTAKNRVLPNRSGPAMPICFL